MVTNKFIPSTQFIEKLPNICVDLELVSVYDMDCYSVPQLLYRLAQKINQTITNMEHNDTALKAQLEDLQVKLEYLLGEGLTTELQKIFEKMYADGTLQSLVEESMVDIKRRLDKVESQLETMKSIKISASELGMEPNSDITNILNNLDTKVKYEIEFIKGAEYFISDTVRIDIFKHSINGNGCIWSSKINDENKWMVEISSSFSLNPTNIIMGGSPCANIVNNFNNIILQTLKGETYYRKSNGIRFNNILGKTAHLVLEKIAVFGFNKGVGFGSQTYMITFDKINVAYCNIGVLLDSGYSDLGEKIHFANGMIGDNITCIVNNTDQALHFHNMSFDFSNKLFDNRGQLYFTNCHLEAPLRYFNLDSEDTNNWGTVKGTGSVFISTSRIMVGYAESNETQVYLPYLFKSDNESATINIINSHTHIFARYFMNDIGICKATQLHKYNTYSPQIYIQKKQNIYIDSNCTKIGNVTSSNDNAPIIENGYKCTHKSKGINQQTLIKLPKIKTHFRLEMLINTDVANNYFFNKIAIRSRNNTQQYEKTFGTKATIAGDNTLTINSMVNREEGKYFNPNNEYELLLQTNDLPNGTVFTIKQIIINEMEN